MKININRKPISSHEIAPMQDFSAVMKGVAAIQQPFYKNPWFAGGAATFVVAAIVIVYLVVGKTNPQPTAHEGTKPFIQPAIEGVDIQFASYKVTSGSGDTITTAGGTKIIVPACPFKNEKGEEVKGEVEIRYREFRDPVDFALSGIPMTYDSAGTKYTFESAGMCEIQGFQNGKAIAVNTDCPLRIEMPQTNVDGKFNMYYLDTVKKNWEYKGKPEWVAESVAQQPAQGDKVVERKPSHSHTSKEIPNDVFDDGSTLFSKGKQEIQTLSKEIDQLKKEKPLEPRKADNTRPRFKLGFDIKDFPELKSYTDVLFEVSKEETGFTSEFYKIDWDKLTLKELVPGVKYKLVMELAARNSPNKKDRIESIVVMPVFEGKDYDAAMKTFKAKFKDYETKLAAKEAEKKRKEEEMRKAQEEAKKKRQAEWEKEQVDRQKQQAELQKQQQETQRKWAEDQKKEVNERSATANNLYNSFAVDKFGIHNCDSPVPNLGNSRVKLSFLVNGEKQVVYTVYQAVLNKKILVNNYYTSCCNNVLKFSENDPTILFTQLPNGKLAYYSVDDFKTIPSKGKHEVELRVSDEKLQTVGEIKAFLGVGSDMAKK